MPGDTQQRIQKKFLRNKHNGRQEIDLYMKKKKISLRKIILLLMILGCLTSAVAIILTSYSSLQLMNQNNIEDNMKMNLYQFTKESDEACYKLLRVLNQMSADGMVGSAVDKYLTQEEHYDQYVNKKNLRAQLVSLNSSSPSLLIAFYYDPYRNCELVPNYANVKISMEYKRAPVLFEATVNTFQGIHGSVFYQNQMPVYSAYRRERFGDGTLLDCYAEVKSEYEISPAMNRQGYDYSVLQLNENGVVTYSTNPKVIKGRKLLDTAIEKETSKVIEKEGYRFLIYRSKLGYMNALSLPKGTYTNEIYAWRFKTILVVLIIFSLFMSFVLYLYHLIGKPIQELGTQIERIGQGSLQDEVIQECGIAEFDQLLGDVEDMKQQIRELIQRSREQEKEAQQMEYEKLVYQINPHFLLNVLNSIQWMAQMSHQKDIGEYTSALKKLLSYNLGKEGRETTLRKEIEMVKNYIFLQQKRYDFEVDISVEEGEYLNVPTVRMMLQPLVENAIRYGLGEEGKIAIQTFFDKKRNLVAVTIEDFGHGLSQKEIDEIQKKHIYDMQRLKDNKDVALYEIDQYARVQLEGIDKKYATIIRANEDVCWLYRRYLDYMRKCNESPAHLIAKYSEAYMNIVQNSVFDRSVKMSDVQIGLDQILKLLQFLSSTNNYFLPFETFIEQRKQMEVI